MRNDDELGATLELRKQFHKATNVLIIKWRVNLVHQAERARLRKKNPEQQRQGNQRALSAGKQMNALRFLAAWRCVHFDVAIKWCVGIFQTQIAFTATKQREKNRAKIRSYLCEHRQEQLARSAVDFAHCLMQRCLGRHEIIALTREKFKAPLFLFMFFNGQRIHRAQFIQRFAQTNGLCAKRIGFELQWFKVCQQVFQRSAPLSFQSLTNCFAAP